MAAKKETTEVQQASNDADPIFPKQEIVRRYVMPRRKNVFNITKPGKPSQQIETTNGVMKLNMDEPNAKKFAEMIEQAGGRDISHLTKPKQDDLPSVMAELMEMETSVLVAMLETEDERAALRNHPAGKLAIVNHLLNITIK